MCPSLDSLEDVGVVGVTVRIKTRVLGSRLRILRVALKPPIPGIERSMRTTSGSLCRQRDMASSPVWASPTTSMSVWIPMILANPLAKSR